MTVNSHRCLGAQTCQLRRRLPFSFPQEHTLQLQQNRSRPASDGSRDSDERAPAELGDSRNHWGEPDVPGARDSRLLHTVRGRAKSRERGRPGGVLSRRVREVFTDPLHPSSRELAGPAWSQDRVPARSFLFPSTRVCLHVCKAHGGAAGIRRYGKPSPVTRKALLLGDWLLRSELPCLIHTQGLITPTSPGSS